MITQPKLPVKSIDTIISQESAHPALQKLLQVAFNAKSNQNLKVISTAYHFAKLAYRGQFRKTGESLLNHCVFVGHSLLDLNQDSSTIAAGLLHEVVEISGISIFKISNKFGKEISELVDGVTKIKDLTFQSEETEQAENLRKMLLSMVQDIRVVLIKFSDRLHNMHTLEPLDPETRRQMALESRDIYAPLAHRLGIAKIGWELEDLSLKWLEPNAYCYIQKRINLSQKERQFYIEEMEKPLEQALHEAGIQAEIQGRPKNYYSIDRKMKNGKKSFEEIYDLFAIRVIVETIPECYQVLGMTHSIYIPIMARFKDFIATPKSNRYQSLHTTVFGPKGIMVEIQIRTQKMHQTAEVGIAAHWLYKDQKTKHSELDNHLVWIRNLLDWQKETTNPHEFIEELKLDLFPSEIYVFTPKGDLIQLPEGATPIDFAFSIHTEIGYHCIEAKIDGQIVPLSTQLKTHNAVEITTSPHQWPNRNWLDFVKSRKAKSYIRRWLREEEYKQSIHLGEEIVKRELNKRRKRFNEKALQKVAAELKQKDLEHLYKALGNGKISVARFIYKLFPTTQETKKLPTQTRTQQKKSALKVHGLNNLVIFYATCCHPIAGDPILGIISCGKDILVHRRNCSNIQKSSKIQGGILEVDWDIQQEETFSIPIQITGLDRCNLLHDITEKMSELSIQVSKGKLATINGQINDQFQIEVKNIQQLNQLFEKILTLPGIISVDRINSTSKNPKNRALF